ncbi:MAG: SDR family oxidoreductase [Acidimicrobiales bacterium]|nr:SDR family oxidoreductase [Acidimicrobiales bacterium]
MNNPLDSNSLDHTGKVVLVTGGTKGVGRGIAARYDAAGATVVVCGRHAPEGEPPAAAPTFLACDVREPDQVTALVDGIVDRFGRLDVVVNNAGGAPWADSATASPRFNEKIIALNLIAPFTVGQAANAVMQNQDDGGSIVNIASVSGVRPSPGTAAYGAAKAGLLNLTETLAVEWAPKVRVNAVVAGMIATEQAHLFYGDATAQARVAATVPAGRLGTPDDVAGACLFLSSPLAAYVSGAALRVHGGNERPAYLAAAAGP